MNTQKAVVGGVLAVLIFVGGWYWLAPQKESTEQSVPTQTAQLNFGPVPLYSGATWGTPVATTSPDFGRVVQVQSAVFASTTNIAEISTPFTTYYHDNLLAAGWVQDMSREAGGPGAEMSVYTKGDQFVVVYFHSNFLVKHADAPSECPCDLTFTLMSGAEAPRLQ